MYDDDTPASGTLSAVLIVEDEGLVSMLIEDIVRDLGASNVHVFSEASAAREAAATLSVDCAVLDIRVRGGNSSEVADILEARGIPFIFTTGSGVESLIERHRHRPLLAKPFADDDLRALLQATVNGAGAQPVPEAAE